MTMRVHTQARPSSAAASCKRSGLGRQFGHPTGLAGRLVGNLMAVKNGAMSRLAVDLLNVQHDDRILEVGFGPGVAVQLAAARASQGLIVGIDRSALMVKQATRRNRMKVQAGRVDLRRGDVSHLPFDDGLFTKAFEINSFHHWPRPEEALVELHRVLRDGGMFLLCLRMAHSSTRRLAAPGHTEEEIAEVTALLRRTGYSDIRSERHRAGRRVTCVFAYR